ncbi:MAG: ABC transporter permease [Propionicimonas sp.]|nr:ABC transporter permease [Propionicimonas sp.]MEA5116956.1 ABC transporter permease [Propionicimonas sp.]
MPRFIDRFLPPVVLSVALVVVLLISSGLSSRFLSVDNLLSALTLASPLGVVAIGMSIVIFTGGIDLSVGSVFAVTAVTMGWSYQQGLPAWAAVLCAVAVGLFCGAVNGLLISALRLPAIVVTLATMVLFSGVVMGATRGGSFPAPRELIALSSVRLWILPAPLVCFLVVLAAVYAVLRWASFGEYLYAFGSNSEALRLAAQRVSRVELSAYMLSGLFSALGAVVYSATVASTKANFGEGYEFAAVTIVVLGGAALTGGKGTVWGTFMATLVIALLQNGLSISFVSPDLQQMFLGLALLIAAVIYRWLPRLVVSKRPLERGPAGPIPGRPRSSPNKEPLQPQEKGL